MVEFGTPPDNADATSQAPEDPPEEEEKKPELTHATQKKYGKQALEGIIKKLDYPKSPEKNLDGQSFGDQESAAYQSPSQKSIIVPHALAESADS